VGGGETVGVGREMAGGIERGGVISILTQARALGRKLANGLGCFLVLAGHTVQMGRSNFHGLNILFQYFLYSKFEKYKRCTSFSPQFSNLY
jgi:hypothetical protein